METFINFLQKLKIKLNPILNLLSALRRCVIPVIFILINLTIVWVILTTSQAQDFLQQIAIDNYFHFYVILFTFLWSVFIYFTANFTLRYSEIYSSSTSQEIKNLCELIMGKVPFSMIVIQLALLNYILIQIHPLTLFYNILIISILILAIFIRVERSSLIPTMDATKGSILNIFKIRWSKVIIMQEGNILGFIISIVLIVSLIFLFLCFFLIFFGQSVSSSFNPLIVILIAASFWLFPSMILSLIDGRYKIPAYTILIIYVWLISGFNNNHKIRIVESEAYKYRPNDIEYANKWITRLIKEEDSLTKEYSHQIPVYLIAGEGGGIRAAYWTGTILAKFDSLDKNFYRHTLALSGVSGSSIGMCFFQSLKQNQESNLPTKIQDLTSKDYLTPLIVGFMFPDMLQRFFPIVIKSSDRARFLEDAFSKEYNYMTNKNNLDSAFLNVNATSNLASPMMFFNSTEVETGRKALISNVKLSDKYFYDVVDVIDSLKADMPMKTAATNSARFPIVTPAGLILQNDTTSSSLVDGGYFENTGLHTTFQLLRLLQNNLVDSLRRRIQPRIIFLRNGDNSLNQPSIGRAYEWSPIFAFFNAWGRKSIPIEYDFNKITPEIFYGNFKAEQFTIPLNRDGKNKTIPLGWTLSMDSRAKINAQFPEILSKYDKIFK